MSVISQNRRQDQRSAYPIPSRVPHSSLPSSVFRLPPIPRPPHDAHSSFTIVPDDCHSVMKGVTMNRRVWLSVLLTVLVIGVVAAIGYGVYQIGFDQGVAATAGETTTVVQVGHRGYGWGFFPLVHLPAVLLLPVLHREGVLVGALAGWMARAERRRAVRRRRGRGPAPRREASPDVARTSARRQERVIHGAAGVVPAAPSLATSGEWRHDHRSGRR